MFQFLCWLWHSNGGVRGTRFGRCSSMAVSKLHVINDKTNTHPHTHTHTGMYIYIYTHAYMHTYIYSYFSELCLWLQPRADPSKAWGSSLGARTRKARSGLMACDVASRQRSERLWGGGGGGEGRGEGWGEGGGLSTGTSESGSRFVDRRGVGVSFCAGDTVCVVLKGSQPKGKPFYLGEGPLKE